MQVLKRTILLSSLLLLLPLTGYAKDAGSAAVVPATKTAPAATAKTVPAPTAPAKTTPATPAVTPTKDVPKGVDPDNIVTLVTAIAQAAKGGQWALLIGLILMLLTWLVNRALKSKIPPKVLPWVSIGLGVLSQVALTVAAGNVRSTDTWVAAITGGITLGLAGAGGWSAAGKYLPVLRKKKPTSEPAPASESTPADGDAA